MTFEPRKKVKSDCPNEKVFLSDLLFSDRHIWENMSLVCLVVNLIVQRIPDNTNTIKSPKFQTGVFCCGINPRLQNSLYSYFGYNK